MCFKEIQVDKDETQLFYFPNIIISCYLLAVDKYGDQSNVFKRDLKQLQFEYLLNLPTAIQPSIYLAQVEHLKITKSKKGIPACALSKLIAKYAKL